VSGARRPCCPVCASGSAALRYRITRFEILDCRDCGLVYLWPPPGPEEIRAMFSQLYTTGEGSVPELRSYYGFCYDDEPGNPLVQSYERWLDEVERHRASGRLLDVGCGTGLFLAVARRRGWEPYGIDDCEEATRHAREHFGLEVWNGEFTDLAAQGRRFDAITGWDVIEHSREPVELLCAARRLLAPGGVIALSTPNQRSILDLVAGALYRASGGRLTAALEKFYIEQHFLYYTPQTLADSLARAGLEVVSLRRELTDLRRLTLAPAMRLALHALFAAARLLGRENRLFVVARLALEPRRQTLRGRPQGLAQVVVEAAKAEGSNVARAPGADPQEGDADEAELEADARDRERGREPQRSEGAHAETREHERGEGEEVPVPGSPEGPQRDRVEAEREGPRSRASAPALPRRAPAVAAATGTAGSADKPEPAG